MSLTKPCRIDKKIPRTNGELLEKEQKALKALEICDNQIKQIKELKGKNKTNDDS